MEMLRNDDFIYSYWMYPGGMTLWLVERQEEMFLFGIFGMQSLRFVHFSSESRRESANAIGNVMNILGAREYPVYANFKQAKDQLAELEQQFEIYRNTVEQAQKAAEEKAKGEKNDAPAPDPVPVDDESPVDGGNVVQMPVPE